MKKEIPTNQHITYQLQYRKCGKASCSTCRNGQGHGPYWYAYWREGPRLQSGYVGKVHPGVKKSSTTSDGSKDIPSDIVLQQDAVSAPALI